MAEIPIQRKERRTLWPWLLLALVVLLAVLWFLFARGNGNVAAARADSMAVANGAITTDSAGGAMVGPVTAADSTSLAGGAVLADADIANAIHEVNAGEIAAGKLAESKASNAEVKAYAREMVQAHQSLDQQAAKLSTGTASGTPASIGDSVMQANDSTAAQLRTAGSGAAFDRAYVDAQVTGHQNALAFLQRAQSQAQDQALKQVIDDAIPDVRQHLEKAQALQAKLGQ